MALEDYKKDMLRCTRCSCCKWIPVFSIAKSWRFAYGCPSIARYNFHSYSGSGKLITSLSLLEGRIDYSDRLLETVYQCTMCGSCDLSCRMGTNMEVLEILRELRAKCVNDGHLIPEHTLMIQNLKTEDTIIQGARKADRGNWASGLKVKDLTKEKAEVVFHAGCRYCSDPELQSIARTVVSLLQNAGVDVGIMGKEETCCGGRVYEMGYFGEFTKYAENNIDAWNTAGVKKVVTACADGYGAVKDLYPRVGKKMNFEVLHVTEYLDQLIKEGKLKLNKKVPLQITYHDPCHLGRLSEPRLPSYGRETTIEELNIQPLKEVPKVLGMNGVFEPPRSVLRAIPGIKLVEMERIKAYSWCCGAGGGVLEAYPDFALWTANERIEEAKSTGAEAIVTACPWCERSFNDAIRESGGSMKVYDIVELVQESI